MSDRAVTAVGDLAEESVDRGVWWFWRQTAGTFAAHLAREFASAPFRLLLCAPFGMLMGTLGLILGLQALGPVLHIWHEIYYHFFPIEGNIFPPPPGTTVFSLGFYAIGLIVLGRGLARFSGQPIAAAIVFSVAWAILWSIMVVNGVRTTHVVPHYGIPQTLVLIGAIWERRRSLESA